MWYPIYRATLLAERARRRAGCGRVPRECCIGTVVGSGAAPVWDLAASAPTHAYQSSQARAGFCSLRSEGRGRSRRAGSGCGAGSGCRLQIERGQASGEFRRIQGYESQGLVATSFTLGQVNSRLWEMKHAREEAHELCIRFALYGRCRQGNHQCAAMRSDDRRT